MCADDDCKYPEAPVTEGHKCDRCNGIVHGICGRPIGAEGFGQIRRCSQCDDAVH